jgi:hypothetical protein
MARHASPHSHHPPKIEPHPLVARVLGEAEAPEEPLAVLLGYFGKEDDGYVRLYTSLDFNAYYHIPRQAIVRTEPVDPANETSPTRVWITRTTKVDLVVTAEASHLQGAITAAHLAGAAPAGRSAPAGTGAAGTSAVSVLVSLLIAGCPC